MPLSFDPSVPLTVPAELQSTHSLKRVVWEGTDRTAFHFQVRNDDGAKDGPYIKYHYFGGRGPARAGVYVDGNAPTEWHTWDQEGTPFSIERTQADGTVRVEEAKADPSLLGILVPNDAGELVKDGWWYDMDDRERLWNRGIEVNRFRRPLDRLHKDVRDGRLARNIEDSGTGNVMNGLLGLRDDGRYSPNLDDARKILGAHISDQHLALFADLFGNVPGIEQTLEEVLDVALQQRNPTNRVLLYSALDAACPPRFDPLWQPLQSRATVTALRELPIARREAILAEKSVYNRWSLIGCVPTRETLAALESTLLKMRKDGRMSFGLSDVAARAPDVFVPWAASFLSGAGKKSKARASVVAALGHTAAAAAVPVLVKMSAESAADLRTSARHALKRLGPLAEAPLHAATQTGSKKLKSTASELLREHRRRDMATPPPEVAALDAAITNIELDGYRDQIWQEHAVERDGTDEEVLAMAALVPDYDWESPWLRWISERSFARREDPIFATLRQRQAVLHPKYNPDLTPLTAWYLDQLPVSIDVFLDAALKGDAWENRAILLLGLGCPNKKRKVQAVRAIASLGDRILDELLPMLVRGKDEQLGVAAVLVSLGCAAAAPALTKALSVAPDAATKKALEEALAACGGPTEAEETPATESGPIDWEVELTKGRKARLPKWMSLESLPPLALRDGTVLSDGALQGFVGKLKKEHERPDPTAWALREHLDPESAHQLGRQLYNLWGSNNMPAAHKWCVYQAALLCDERFPNRLGDQLDSLASWGRHALAGWLLDTFDRMPHSTGADWVGYWADHGTSHTVHKTANIHVKNRAQRAGLSIAAYKGTLDPMVASKAIEDALDPLGFDAEGKLSVKGIDLELKANLGLEVKTKGLKNIPGSANTIEEVRNALDRARGSLTRTLEDAMVGGRRWEPSRFERLWKNPLFASVACNLVFQIGEHQALATASGFVAADGKAIPMAPPYGILHPLEIESLDAWSVSEQPFEQLRRTTYPKAPALDIPSRSIKPGKALDAFNSSLWNRGPVEDAGWSYSNWMRMPQRGLGQIELNHSGLHAANPSYGEDVTLESVSLKGCDGATLEPVDVHPVAFSEVQRAIHAVFPAGPKRSSAVKGKVGSRNLGMSSGYPTADMAPSNRAKCIHCADKIVKGTVRVVVEREVDTAYFQGMKPGYLHPACTGGWSAANGHAFDDVRATVYAHSDLDGDLLNEIS